MESVILATRTAVSKVGNVISIFTEYVNDFLFRGFITDKKSSLGTVNYLEGELVFEVDGYIDIDVYINNNGELILNSFDDKDFYINSNGELIMEIEE